MKEQLQELPSGLIRLYYTNKHDEYCIQTGLIKDFGDECIRFEIDEGQCIPIRYSKIDKFERL